MQLLHRSDCSLKQTYNKTKQKRKKRAFFIFFPERRKIFYQMLSGCNPADWIWGPWDILYCKLCWKMDSPTPLQSCGHTSEQVIISTALCVCVCVCVWCVCVFLWVLPAAKSIISQSKQSIKKHKWSSNPRGETLHQFTPCVEANQPV